ncbi:MAG: SIR2 family protein [Solirubrobacterales bacterium]
MNAPSAGVFINYRRSEAAGWARALYEKLAARFGRDKVFFDQESLRPGEKWAEGIRSESAGCGVLIALIGPRWTESLNKRLERREGDYVRSEIETALKAEGQEVIPTLIEGARLPSGDDLGYLRSLQPLLKHQQAELSPSSSWDADVERLIERLKQLGVVEATGSSQPPRPATEPSPVSPAPAPAEPPAPAPPAAASPSVAVEREDGGEDDEVPKADPPSRAHYDELAELMLDEAFRVVPFLGPEVNSCDRAEPWGGDIADYLPDSDELARYLAQKIRTGNIGAKEAALGLALASQSLSIKKGADSLYGALEDALKEEVLPPRRLPGSVHCFLAKLPKTLRSLGAAESCQLIVTANYDNALERAFDEAEEAYDLAVYMPSKGTFLHVPFDGEPKEVEDASSDDSFPIVIPRGRLKRTVIMKVHGAIDQPQGLMDSQGCVITEDDYIGYMSKGGIESIVPTQLLAKLRRSRFLFLGHEMHDWSLRVFLLRVLGEAGLSKYPSWALQRDASDLDERFWQKLGTVELFAARLDEYVKDLGEGLVRGASARQPQS